MAKLGDTRAFDERYKRLNKAQKEAVDSIEGPVMVIAGPGTGKTTILTLRIANILRQTDTPAHGILAITYTDAGVKAMRGKLREVIGNRAHEVAIHTFHSFASGMMAEYPDHFAALDGFRAMTDVERELMVRNILAAPSFKDLRPMGNPDYHIPQILRGIEDAKKDALTPAMVREYAEKEIERIKSSEDLISTRGASKGKLKAEALDAIEKCKRTLLLADIYERYEEAKVKEKKLDFDDLIIELLKAMESDELFLRLIQERFLYVLVDEHQDTNDAQNLIVRAIAQFFETPNIFIVGDEKQAIYRFQGASVENFLALQKRWPGMRVISLDTNYRSHQKLLDAGFSVIENNYEGDEHKELRIVLRSGSNEEGRPIEAVVGENTASIERFLIERLKDLQAKEPKTTIAIITRRNREVERVIRLLEADGMPVSSERSVDIFHHPIGSIFFDLLEYLDDPSKADALAKTLAAGMWGRRFEEAAGIIKSLRSGKTAGLDESLPGLLHIQRKMLNDAPLGSLIFAAQGSGFIGLVSKDPSYVYVWRGIMALAESLVREGRIQSPAELMRSLLAYRRSAESKAVKVSVGAPDLPIRAMTAHGSKGLEFDYVFMPYATEEAWIGRPRGSSFVLPRKRIDDHDIRDTRRLFYVALTRARKHCAVLASKEESDGKGLTPLRFIAELDPACVETISLPRAISEPATARPGDDRPYSGSSKLAALAKEVLMDTGLSVTALNHFKECPNKFLYLSILKLPQAPSAPAEKGTAMHEAISMAWKLEDRSVAGIEAALIKGISSDLDDSFLAVNEKEAVRAELTDAVPAVAKALHGHFNQSGIVSTERWFKAMFEGSYGGDKVSIPIHGKLDAMLEAGDDIAVYDYKTRKAMSENAIKGLTKDSSGDYFRQLVFYKLLLSLEPRYRLKRVSPALVFVSPDDKGRCSVVSLPIADSDMKALKEQIQSVIDAVWSGNIAASFCAEPDCEWCGLKRAGM